MASVMKHDHKTAKEILRHGGRKNKTYRNPDIDSELTKYNKSFIYDDNGNDISYDLYKKRLEEVYVFNRKDVKTLCSWVVTLPKEFDYMSVKEVSSLMWHVHNFLCDRYGRENAVQSVVHYDESGEPHLHFCFVPVVPDPKHHKESGLKVCAADVVNRKDLQTFHADLRDYLNKNVKYPLDAGSHFYTGVTKAQGGNRAVSELKTERAILREIERLQGELERVRGITADQTYEYSQSRWGFQQEVEHEIEF